MNRPPSGILFGLILSLSLAFVTWWTIFQSSASRELEAAGASLVAGDSVGVARAFGVADGEALRALGRSRFWMFASEGAVFAVALALSGSLYWASVRRETALRAAQDRFLAGATHELKTPLATISLLLESLRDDRLPPAKRDRYLRMGLLEAERLEHGITNVLVAAGLRSTGVGNRRRSPGDLSQDVRDAASNLERRAAAANITLEVEAEEEVLSTRDPEAMQLILHNLIDNAIKYSPSGSKVHISLRARNGEAEITVIDPGRGMSADELAHAFEPFWRGDDNAKGGSGLGLHLVRELVTAHGGRVEAESAGRGAGTSMRVNLPIAGDVS